MDLLWQEAVMRIVVATILGAVVGFERELTNKHAGLRTHMLVCLGSTVFTLISVSSLMVGLSPAEMAQLPEHVQLTITRDPGRIAAQIVTGIGFIGGGAVLRYGTSIRGLTTAASLWMVASIGMLTGTGHYALATITTLITFLVLFSIGKLERVFFDKHAKRFNRLRIAVTCPEIHSDEIQAAIARWVAKELDREIIEIANDFDSLGNRQAIEFLVDTTGLKLNMNTLSQRFTAINGMSSAKLELICEDVE